jgi:hypothetical protein
MKAFIASLCFLFSQTVSFSQALMDFDFPIVDNEISFFKGLYDTALLRKNKVAVCELKNLTFYFDSNGRLVKSILIPYDSATQVELYRYDVNGDLIEQETTSPKFPAPIITTTYKTYKEGRLIKDSSGYFCRHFTYYDDGNLRQELWYGPKHRLQKAFWFGVDSAGRMNRIISRDYYPPGDSAGRLVSNKTLFYNEKNQLIREEETVAWKESQDKNIFCPNAGSARFAYDSLARLIEITTTAGPSQKIKYFVNGLISEIETDGKNCNGMHYHWKKEYTYTYR